MKYSLEVENIKCGGCAKSIERGLKLNEKIQSVKIEIESGKIEIKAGKDLDLESIKSDLHKLGYPEKNSDNSVVTRAKSFVSCALGRIGK